MDPYAQYASCEVSSADSLATACAYVIYLNVSTPSPTQTDVFAYGVLLWEIATRGGGKFYCMYAKLASGVVATFCLTLQLRTFFLRVGIRYPPNAPGIFHVS